MATPSSDATGCNITLNVTDTKQYFATEGYNYVYKNDQDRHFNFEAPLGRRILIFFEHFELEVGYVFLHFRKLNNFKQMIQNADTHTHWCYPYSDPLQNVGC